MFVPMQWVDGKWEIKPCPAVESPGRLAECERWLEAHRAELPRPQRQPRDVVVFLFGDRQMRGDVREVDLCYLDDQVFQRGIYYTIYANGHGRWVHESDLCGVDVHT